MATASLVLWRFGGLEHVPGTIFEIQTSPFDAEPFSGPADRDWDAFAVLSEDAGTFEWRTGIDRIREVVREVAEGRLTIGRALKSPQVRSFVDRVEACLGDSIPESVAPRNVGRWVLQQAYGNLDEIGEMEGDFSVYQADEDDYFHDAAQVLPLPPWAKYKRIATGGIGSGYDSAMIVLKPGRTLSDYRDWLADKFGAGAVRR